jgi:hypothetical protein
MLDVEVAMDIRVNGQRYKSWDRIPAEVRRELVDSGLFQDGDGSGVPVELLPTAGAATGLTSRYALTVNGVSYGPGKPVPALLASVMYSVGDRGHSRAPFQRPRQRTVRMASTARTAMDGRPASSTGSNQSRPTGRQAPSPSGQVHRKATTGPVTPQPRSDSQSARWDTPAVTSWQGPPGSERTGGGMPGSVAEGGKAPAHFAWVGAGRSQPATAGSKHPTVIVETRGVSRGVVLAGLLALAVLVVVLLAVTGT